MHHASLFTGGEYGKYTGFVPASPRFEDRQRQRGLVRFFDCCGALSEDAPGCCSAPHEPFDD